jgi:hypothetical protein
MSPSRARYRAWLRGCSSEAEHQLPKLRTGVRFPSPAQRITACFRRSEAILQGSLDSPLGKLRVRKRRQLGAVGDAELVEHVWQVCLDRGAADEEAFADLGDEHSVRPQRSAPLHRHPQLQTWATGLISPTSSDRRSRNEEAPSGNQKPRVRAGAGEPARPRQGCCSRVATPGTMASVERASSAPRCSYR